VQEGPQNGLLIESSEQLIVNYSQLIDTGEQLIAKFDQFIDSQIAEKKVSAVKDQNDFSLEVVDSVTSSFLLQHRQPKA
jgi:hypothetical protein